MTQAVRIRIDSAQPVESPVPVTRLIPIAKPTNGHTVVAVPCDATDLPYYAGRWLIVERDPKANLIRESSATYPTEKHAYYAWWNREVEFEKWVAPIWATHALKVA